MLSHGKPKIAKQEIKTLIEDTNVITDPDAATRSLMENATDVGCEAERCALQARCLQEIVNYNFWVPHGSILRFIFNLTMFHKRHVLVPYSSI